MPLAVQTQLMCGLLDLARSSHGPRRLCLGLGLRVGPRTRAVHGLTARRWLPRGGRASSKATRTVPGFGPWLDPSLRPAKRELCKPRNGLFPTRDSRHPAAPFVCSADCENGPYCPPFRCSRRIVQASLPLDGHRQRRSETHDQTKPNILRSLFRSTPQATPSRPTSCCHEHVRGWIGGPSCWD